MAYSGFRFFSSKFVIGRIGVGQDGGPFNNRVQYNLT